MSNLQILYPIMISGSTSRMKFCKLFPNNNQTIFRSSLFVYNQKLYLTSLLLRNKCDLTFFFFWRTMIFSFSKKKQMLTAYSKWKGKQIQNVDTKGKENETNTGTWRKYHFSKGYEENIMDKGTIKKDKGITFNWIWQLQRQQHIPSMQVEYLSLYQMT